MKKLALLLFTLLLTVSVSTQAQEKKNFEGAIAAAGLTEEETTKALEINNEKMELIKAVRKEKLEKEAEDEKIKEIRKASTDKVKALIGKEKFKLMQKYWADK